MVDHNDNPKPVRRIEIMMGDARRRRWSAEEKGRIVAESFAPGAVASEVARRHDMRPQQLTGWRRDAREGRLALPAEALAFAPIVVARGGPASRAAGDDGRAGAEMPIVEIESCGVVVRMRESAPAALLELAVRALRSPA